MTDSTFTIAVVQCALADSRDDNVERVIGLIRKAAGLGANIVLYKSLASVALTSPSTSVFIRMLPPTPISSISPSPPMRSPC